jgi:hypothetical protein
MHLRFLGKESTPTNSPTLYATDRDSFVVQGWIVTDPEILSNVDLADDETVVEVPPGLMYYLAADGLSGEVGKPVPPVVHVNEKGNFIVRGRRLTDDEALDQMTIPDHETSIEVTRAAMATLLVGG